MLCFSSWIFRRLRAFGVFNRIDSFLISPPVTHLAGMRRAGLEFLWFGIKELRACLFAGLFFFAIFCVPRAGVLGIARYDLLLLIALAIQLIMVATRLETWDELKAITLFHLLGFGLELFSFVRSFDWRNHQSPVQRWQNERCGEWNHWTMVRK